MLKRVIAGCSLLAMSLCANADFIVTDESITGDLMAGMEVTVSFADGSTDSGVWSVLTNTALMTGDPIIDMNGFSGGVVAADWSLTQAGFTQGGFDNAGTAYGLWTLTNTGSASGITGFSVNGFTDTVKVAFDIDSDNEVTPGSNVGMAFVSDPNQTGTTATYANQVNASFSDLFFQLDVMLESALDVSGEVRFFADTDLVQVSTPATLALMLGGLVLVARRKALV